MNFNLSEEQDMLRDAVARYSREQYGFEARQKLVAAGGYSAVHWRAFAEMGWLALETPEALGGLGLGIVEMLLIAEELGRALVLEPYSHTTAVTARLLTRCAQHSPASSAERAAAVLADLLDGSRLVVTALREPGQRYAVVPRASTVQASGHGWRLSGARQLVPHAEMAEDFLLAARMPEGDLGLFLLPAHAEGLHTSCYPLIDGSAAGDLHAAGVVLDGAALLCRGHAIDEWLEEAADRGAVAMVAEGLGVAEGVIELTAEYIRTRQQFGQAIGRFQALQHRMAEMFVEVQELRSILLRAVAGLAAPPRQRREAASAAKVMLADTLRIVGGQCIQLHGGIGLTEEYLVGNCYKRLLVLERTHGDVDWHLTRFVGVTRERATLD